MRFARACLFRACHALNQLCHCLILIFERFASRFRASAQSTFNFRHAVATWLVTCFDLHACYFGSDHFSKRQCVLVFGMIGCSLLRSLSEQLLVLCCCSMRSVRLSLAAFTVRQPCRLFFDRINRFCLAFNMCSLYFSQSALDFEQAHDSLHCDVNMQLGVRFWLACVSIARRCIWC